MQRKFTSLISFLAVFIYALPVWAEDFKITVSGSELKNLTAIEFKLAIKPEKSFLLDENIEIFDVVQEKDKTAEVISAQPRVLYKVVDAFHNSIRVFFHYPIKTKTMEINGKIIRGNFSGSPELSIAEVNYISDFSLSINPDKLDTKIEITSKEEVLPYKGISKAEILGPHQRIYNSSMFITIGNIETYGFNLDSEVNHFKINGQEAKLIDNNIIAARLNLTPGEIPESLPITLEIEVDNQTVRKDVGSIEFFENLN